MSSPGRRVCLLAALVCIVLSQSALAADPPRKKPLRVAGGELQAWNWPVDYWCIQLPEWTKTAAAPATFPALVQPWCEHGVNAIGIAVQDLAEAERFFSPDGSISPEGKRHFAAICKMATDHWLTPVVSLFSAERSMWLESREAYLNAAKAAAALIDKRRTAIFVAGDVFGTGQWSEECPYPMRDPSALVELCRSIRAGNPDVLLAIPAPALESSPGQRLLYVADNPDALAELARRGVGTERACSRSGDAGDLPAGVAVLNRDRFLRFADARDQLAPSAKRGDSYQPRAQSEGIAASPERERGGSVPAPSVSEGIPASPERERGGSSAAWQHAIDRYLDRVTSVRMAVQGPPATQPAGKPLDTLTPEEKADGFVPLFDGATLSGWTTLYPNWESWRVEDGEIHCLGLGGQWLRSRERFSSFILRLDFKIAKDGNCGIFLWAPLDGRCSRFGFEMQIRGRHTNPPDGDTTGAVYMVLPPREDAGREPLEWNSAEIECRGSKVRITINGRLVHDFDADAVPALKGRLRQGLIGLQDHDCHAWFRNIRIRRLEEPATRGK